MPESFFPHRFFFPRHKNNWSLLYICYIVIEKGSGCGHSCKSDTVKCVCVRVCVCVCVGDKGGG